MGTVKHLDSSNFNETIANGIVLVDFWAEWCGPCKMLGPILDEIAEEVVGKAVISKINVDDAQDIAGKYKVRSIPAIFIFKDGELVNQLIGLQDKQTLIDAVNNA